MRGELNRNHGHADREPHQQRENQPAGSGDAAHRRDQREPGGQYPDKPGGAGKGHTSTDKKKKPSSRSASSAESDPCTEFASSDCAKSLRMVPRSAFAGSVAPMISRLSATASGPSSTWTTTGPEIMKSTRLR